jgi:hypothetical protein
VQRRRKRAGDQPKTAATLSPPVDASPLRPNDCITWVALVNTEGTGSLAGADYDAVGGINSAMGDAISQASVQTAITNSTVDLFPTYVGP